VNGSNFRPNLFRVELGLTLLNCPAVSSRITVSYHFFHVSRRAYHRDSSLFIQLLNIVIKSILPHAMSTGSIIDLRSPSPQPRRVRRVSFVSPPPNLPPTPPVRFRSLLNPPRPATRSHILPEGGAGGRRLADVIRQRAEDREAREASADSALAWRPHGPRRVAIDLPPPRAGPSRAGAREEEPIDLVGSSDDDDDIVMTGASNVPRPAPVGQPLPVPRRVIPGNGGFDRAMEGELGVFDCIILSKLIILLLSSTLLRYPLHALVLAEFDQLLERRREAANAILATENDERRRAVLSPPPVQLPRRIGFGGAVYRAGDRQINYEPLPDGYNQAARIRADNAVRQWEAVADDFSQPRVGGAGWRARMGQMVAALGGIPMRMEEHAGWRGAGGAGRREDDVAGIINKVELPGFDPPQEGFTVNFEVEEVPSPIALDEDGRVIASKSSQVKTKPYLSCATCPEPLLVGSAYRSFADRVWALRCGHMVDQRCLDALSTPMTEDELASVHRHPPGDLPILGVHAVSVKKSRSKRAKVTKRTSPPPPAEYEWRCPVEGCGRQHWSVEEGDGWVQKEGEGALSVYA